MGDLAASVEYLLAGLSMPSAAAGDALPANGNANPSSARSSDGKVCGGGERRKGL